MTTYQLAQINIARMRGVNIEDPIMKEFVDNLDSINYIAEQSEGFIWRLKDDDNNATAFNPYDDEQIIINISVWQNFETFRNFIFESKHIEYMKRRKEWFQSFGKAYTGMWWIKAGIFPTIEDAVDKLSYLQEHGPSEFIFDFKKQFPKPSKY